MKKILLLTLNLLLCGLAQAQDFVVVPGTIPTELKLILEDLTNSEAKTRATELLKKINANLNLATKKNVFFIIKSEIYKTVLDFEYDKYTPNIYLGQNLFLSAEEKFKKYQATYSSFSAWIIRSFLSDLKFRIDTEKGLENIVEGKYLRPWFNNILSLSPQKFNQLTHSIAQESLLRINYLSGIVKNQTLIDEKSIPVTYFHFTSNSPNKKPLPSNKPKTEEMLKNIVPKQEIIDQEIDQITQAIDGQNKSEWKPKNNGLPAPLDENADSTPIMESSDWKPKSP